MESGFRDKKNFFQKNKKILIIIVIFLLIGLSIFLIIHFRNASLEPQIKMVSGTEYISGEEGQVIVRLEDFRGNPILDADCIVSLLFPDKSFFLTDVSMNLSTIPGNYFHTFVTPQTPGIYEKHIICTVTRDDDEFILTTSYSFHVSPGLNLIVEMSKSQREQYNELLERLNNLDANLTAKIDSVDNRVYNVQNYIDTNVMAEINELNQDIYDLNVTLSDSVVGIEGRLNQTLLNNFDELYGKFRDSYNVMASIFGSD